MPPTARRRRTPAVRLHLAGCALSIRPRPGSRPAPLVALARAWSTRKTPELVLRLVASPPETPAWPPRWTSDGARRRLASRDFAYDVDLLRGRGELWIATPEDPAPWDGALRNLVAALTLARGGLVLHGAAMADEEGAYVMLGPSGAGKTTAARLLAPPVLLSDEFVHLRPRRRDFAVHPCPAWDHLQWGFSGRRPRSLRAIYCLRGEGPPGFRPLSLAEAFGRLLHRPVSESLGDAELADQLESLERLLRRTPCWEGRLALDGPNPLPHRLLRGGDGGRP